MTPHSDLIDALASDVSTVSPRSPERQLALGLIAGGAVTLTAVITLFGVQPDLDTLRHASPLAVKAGYALALAIIGLALVQLLSRPGGVTGTRWRQLAIPVAALGVLAIAQLWRIPIDGWRPALLGASWSQCPVRIAALALPIFAGLSIAVRAQAPTQLRAAGAAVGLVSGAVAATVYALACPESSAAFILIWYSAGITLAAGLGALLGPKILRW